jgi:DNA-directed RNA polymerase subunit RPC12/RpoP
VCHKRFQQQTGLVMHIKIHKDKKDYVCSACGKDFSQRQALLRHERIHAGVKPFSCALCKRKFTDSSILRRHMILIHKKDPKNWREDTQSHLPLRTDFFVSVINDTQDKVKNTSRKKSPAAGKTPSDKYENLLENYAEFLPYGDTSVEEKELRQPEADPLNSSMDDSFTFIPVGVGPSLHHLAKKEAVEEATHADHASGYLTSAAGTAPAMLAQADQVHLAGVVLEDAPQAVADPHQARATADGSVNHTLTTEISSSCQVWHKQAVTVLFIYCVFLSHIFTFNCKCQSKTCFSLGVQSAFFTAAGMQN